MPSSKTNQAKIRLIEQQSSNKSYRTTDETSPEVSRKKGVSVIWKNLRVTSHVKKQSIFRSSGHIDKEIIHDVSGCVKPSSLVAIMGASGSGKSTFMTCLANRHPAELRIDGDIRINGQRMKLKHLKRISGFVYQDDLFIPTLTVLEHLNFAAQMKLDRRISATKRREIIDELLSDVGLTKCKNNLIGSASFGTDKVNLSGGEQKRLSVATELLTDPSLLFCDEPTTGLDSFSALKLISVMKDMTSHKNKTIICSIHQPNEQIFSLFHQVILLYDGRIAFSGSPLTAVDFFKNLGFPLAEYQNPADFLVKSLAIMPGKEEESAIQSLDICTKFENSEYFQDIYEYMEENTRDEAQGYLVPPKVERIPWYSLFTLMLYRNCLEIFRDPSCQRMSIIYKTLLALFIGIFLRGTVTMTQEGIQSLKGVICTMVAENVFSPTFAAVAQIPGKMAIFTREYSNDMNKPMVFYMAHVIATTPWLIIDASIFGALLYWLTQLRYELNIYLWSVAINVMVLILSNTRGLLISIIAGSIDLCHLILLPMDIIFLTLSGIFVNLRTLPFYIYWIRYVSYMTLAFEELLILQVADVTSIKCRSDPSLPCLKTGEEVLQKLDFSANNFTRNVIIMIFLYFVMHISGMVILSVKMYNKTKSKSLHKTKAA